MNDATLVNSKTTKDALPEGYQLHWFELLSVLGRGGYGVTYLALDRNLDRKVAIKEYLPVDFAARRDDQTVEPLSSEQADMYRWGLARFLKEARTLAKFNHPNIVRVISVFEQNGTAYMVMEYEHGKDLSTVLKEQTFMAEDELLDIFIPVIDGLSLVHEAGFIHRDIKPSNIYIREDKSPVLLDFGSARQSTGQTRTLTSLVTYGYAPFEQYNEGNERQGPWTDIYSLGATLYYCITKKKPEDAMRRGGCILSKIPDPYQPVSLLAKNSYSTNFLLSVDHAMRFHVEDRPQDTITWAQMLLGNIKLSSVPTEFMTEIPKPVNGPQITNTTDTVIRPRFRSDSSGNSGSSMPNTGERLIDSSGRRMRTFPTTEKLSRSEIIPPRRELPPPVKKSRLGIVIAVLLASLIVVVAMLVFTSKLPIAKYVASWTSVVNQTSPTATQDITSLLKLAEQDIAAGRLVQPEQNNAFFHYSQVLQVDANNKLAQAGINTIAKQYAAATQRAIKSGDVENAELQLSYLELVLPRSSEAINLREQLLAIKDKSANIDELLTQAKNQLAANRLTEPEGDNALANFRKVLSLDTDNKPAKQGIATIYSHYKNEAIAQLSAGDLNNIPDLLTKMESIKPGASDTRQIQQRYQNQVSKTDKVNRTLELARNAYKDGRYISPESNNAFYFYNSVLNSDAKNDTARQGIKNIQSYYKREFESALSRNQFDQAQQMLDGLKVVETNTAIVNKAVKDLKDRQTPARPDMEEINELIVMFKTSMENKDMTRMSQICEFSPGRQQYLAEFYANYRSSVVSITNFVYIANAHKATANIQFDHLVNNKGLFEPTGSWAKFKIVLKRNQYNQWRVFW